MTVILTNAARFVSFIRPGTEQKDCQTEDAAVRDTQKRYRLKAEYAEIFERELRQEFSGQQKSLEA